MSIRLNIIQDQLFSNYSLNSNNLFGLIQSLDNDFIKMTLLRDKVFQIYQKHIKISTLINNSRELFRTKNYVDSSSERFSLEEFLNGVSLTISTYSKWLTKFVKELPGFSELSDDDLKQIILRGFMTTVSLQLNEFFLEKDTIFIMPNGYLMSKDPMNIAFGVNNSTVSFVLHSCLKKLDLTDKERSLIYPFILTHENSKQNKSL